MPKREPTPPLDDDLKYFVVNYPYPLHADMKIPEERETFAKWIACCIGQDYFFAIYHKPSSPNMVIIEVAKNCPNVDKTLLGAHKWCEFLKKPEADQMSLESKVFYCLHARSREVQKHGWKRIDVHDSWFNKWTPEKSEFVATPYPSTRYCDLPAETQTNARLCRPLPQSAFPKPKQETPPVPVGSNVWINNKIAGVPIGPQQPKREQTKKKEPQSSVDVAVRWPSNSSTASSEDSHPVSPAVSRTPSTLPPPPGLGPPPGLVVPTPLKPSTPGPEMTSIDSNEDLGLPMASTIISTKEVDSAKVGDLTLKDDEEDPEQYWAKQNPWKVDWDKQICPVHKQACKPGICKDMAKLERQKKKWEEAKEKEEAKRKAADARRVEKAIGDAGDGWSVAGSGGGRGARGGANGRGGSHTRGTRGGASDRGGRGGTTGRGGSIARGGSTSGNAWGGAATNRGGRSGSSTDSGGRGTWSPGRGVWGGSTERGGRGGGAWGANEGSMASHLQRTTSAPRGGRGEWTRGVGGERDRGRGRGQAQSQPARGPKSPTSDNNEWTEAAAGTPWDDDQVSEQCSKADAPAEENTSTEVGAGWNVEEDNTPWDVVKPKERKGNAKASTPSYGNSKTEVGSGWKKEDTPWDDVDKGQKQVGASSTDNTDAWPIPGAASGPSAWDMDSWGAPAADVKTTQGAGNRGQGPSSDPWSGRRGGPW